MFIVQILHWNKKDIQSWFSMSNKDGCQCSFLFSNLEYPGVTIRDMSLLSWPCSLIATWSCPPGYHCSLQRLCFQTQKLKSWTWGEGRYLKRTESMSSFQSRRQGLKNHFLRGRDGGSREWAAVYGDKEDSFLEPRGRTVWQRLQDLSMGPPSRESVSALQDSAGAQTLSLSTTFLVHVCVCTGST